MGQDEIEAGQFKIKNMYLEQEQLVKAEDIEESLLHLIEQYNCDLEAGKVVFKECKEEEEEKP